uniref:Fibroblast growth factor n=1 Tax=Ditylenchus dipsaci TaxID=166011 RepID=A0A915DD86_9BILA
MNGLAPSSSFTPSTSSLSLLPPFDLEGSRLVARCALAAQHKQRKNSELWAPVVRCQIRESAPQGALFCRSGTWLEIVGPNSGHMSSHRRREHSKEDNDQDQDYNPEETWKGIVRGTRRESSRFSILEFITVAFGLVSIRGIASQHYLCMDGRGRLYSAPQSKLTPECVFMEEMLENYYNLYSSCSFGTRKKRGMWRSERREGCAKASTLAKSKSLLSSWSSTSTLTISHLEADPTRIHPDFLGYVAENWRSFYSTTTFKDKTRQEDGKKKNLVQQHNPQRQQVSVGVFSPPPKSGRTAAPSSAGAFAQGKWQTATPSHPHHPHRHHNTHQPAANNEPLVVVVDSTVIAANEKFRKDMRRRRRLEREERQRQRRKMELESLRLSSISQRNRLP